MKVEEVTDCTLVERIRHKDASAMTNLYRRYDQPLRCFLLNRVNIAGDVEDVIQETMTSVWRFAGSYRGESSVKVWVYTIARNLAYQLNRKRSTTESCVDGQSLAEASACDDRDLDEVQWSREFEVCLSRLTKEYRNTLLLTYYAGYTQQEAAAIQGCSVNTIKKRSCRARMQLRVDLEQLNVESYAGA